MTIPWTKCSERMPLADDDYELVILRNVENGYSGRLFAWRLKVLSPEAWQELNKNGL